MRSAKCEVQSAKCDVGAASGSGRGGGWVVRAGVGWGWEGDDGG